MMTKFIGYALLFYVGCVLVAFAWDEGKRFWRKRHVARSVHLDESEERVAGRM
jgi:hypothetical protein